MSLASSIAAAGAVLIVALSVLPAASVRGPSVVERASPKAELRVCADPNNLPFSNVRGEGFEDAIARLVADDLGRTVAYTWWPQRRGFARNTLNAGVCDVMLGIPARYELAWPTTPYYRSVYVFVTRRDRGLDITSFDDPELRRVRIGVHVVGDDYANVPPAQALANRSIVGNITGYRLYADYSRPNPPAALIDAVVSGDIDVAIAWGPLAGYFARKHDDSLRVVPVSPEVDAGILPLAFDISMGVRRGDLALHEELEGVLARRGPDIRAILQRFGIPVREVPPGPAGKGPS